MCVISDCSTCLCIDKIGEDIVEHYFQKKIEGGRKGMETMAGLDTVNEITKGSCLFHTGVRL